MFLSYSHSMATLKLFGAEKIQKQKRLILQNCAIGKYTCKNGSCSWMNSGPYYEYNKY